MATCKSGMRLKRKVGDWIAGFTSVDLNGDKVGEECLIYLMLISEKLNFEDYWNDKRFLEKRNNVENPEKPGDQIYKPDGNGRFTVLANPFHPSENPEFKKDDLSGEFVLVADEFYYFGNQAIKVDHRRIHVPKGPAPYGYETNGESADRFIKFMREEYPRDGIIGHPHQAESGSSCCR